MKRIKFLLLTLALAFCVSAAWAQAEHVMTKEELRQVIIETNARLPMPMGQMMELSSMNLSERELVITIGVNDAFGSFAKTAQRPADQLKEGAIMSLGSMDDGDIAQMIKAVASNGLNLRMVYAILGTDTKLEILLTPTDLQRVMQMDKSPLTFLKQTVSASRLSLPMPMGNGLTMTDIKLTDRSFEYVIEVDESQLGVKAMKQQEENIRRSMEQMLGRGNDVSMMLQMNALVQCGKDLIYTYVGNVSKQTYSIAIPCKRLSELLKNYGEDSVAE